MISPDVKASLEMVLAHYGNDPRVEPLRRLQALERVPMTEPVPLGFEVRHCADWPALTKDANDRFRYSVTRIASPYCGDDDVRVWHGRTLEAAMQAAHKSLGMPLPTPPESKG